LIHHITTTHILPTSGGHEKMSYQDLYIMWHIVSCKPLNLPQLIMKNVLRSASKVDGALPYGMVSTMIISHCGIVVGNEVPSRTDVGDIYNASSLKRMDWKRVHDTNKGFVWLPKERGRRRRRVECEGADEQRDVQRLKHAPAPKMQKGQSSSNSSSHSMEILAELKKLHIKIEKMRDEFLDLFDDQRRGHRRLENKLVSNGLIDAVDISELKEEEEEEEEEEEGEDDMKQ
ncbi:hypothetical protein CFOL_v3_03003, partial [Cephalotus follicularis]